MIYYFASFVSAPDREDITRREEDVIALGVKGRLLSFYHVSRKEGGSDLLFNHYRRKKRNERKARSKRTTERS